MDGYRFAAYGIADFSQDVKNCLQEIAQCLLPHKEAIVRDWVERQWNAWQPPDLGRDDLQIVFHRIFSNLLDGMNDQSLELCLSDLEDEGRQLAGRSFPFQALIISVHYLEESYMPILLGAQSQRSQEWLIAMDEFLHSALAAIATSYFEANRKELLEEAEAGRIVQEGLLADIPGRALDLEIGYIYISAHENARLGGDFLDYFELGDSRAAFLIGDLSGHGLKAAAHAVMLRSLFRGFMREHPDIARAFARANRVLTEELGEDQFATAVGVVYEIPGRVRLINAGHPYPIVCTGECDVVESSGLALGVDGDASYEVEEVDLPEGAVLAAYTDGLTEAGPKADQFGEARVMEVVSGSVHAPARTIAQHLVHAALRHAGGRFEDDVAVLIIKRRGQDHRSAPTTMGRPTPAA